MKAKASYMVNCINDKSKTLSLQINFIKYDPNYIYYIMSNILELTVMHKFKIKQ